MPSDRKKHAGGLAEMVRANLRPVRHGFAPWHERLPADARAEVDEVKRAWLAGKLGAQMRPVALLVAKYLADNGICTIGEQGVIAWLKKP